MAGCGGAALTKGAATSPIKPRDYWAGYLVNAATYRTVSASWVEPTANCYGEDQNSAIWVGLGGWLTGGIEQTGSNIICDGTTAHYGAWYELVLGAGSADNAFEEYSKTVKPGDHLHASATSEGDGRYKLVVSNFTEHWTETKNTQIFGPGASDGSAEVIYEEKGSYPPVGRFTIQNARVDGSPIGRLGPTAVHATKANGARLDFVSPIAHADSFTFTVFPPAITDPHRLTRCLQGMGYTVDLVTAPHHGHVNSPLEPITPTVTAYLRIGDASGPDLADAITYDRVRDARAAQLPVSDPARFAQQTKPQIADSTLYLRRTLPTPGGRAAAQTASDDIQVCA
jgi:hypothetical protein